MQFITYLYTLVSIISDHTVLHCTVLYCLYCMYFLYCMYSLSLPVLFNLYCLYYYPPRPQTFPSEHTA
jgi:hypothetical protein